MYMYTYVHARTHARTHTHTHTRDTHIYDRETEKEHLKTEYSSTYLMLILLVLCGIYPVLIYLTNMSSQVPFVEFMGRLFCKLKV